MSGFPSFEQFVREIHGFEPFPWQSALARQVLEEDWPSTISIPTGLGKTMCIDLAVWLMAKDQSRHHPTRIWYVVDRRLLVDAAFERAKLLQEKLNDALDRKSGTLYPVAQALRARSALGTAQSQALHITNLRGGLDQYSIVSDPSQPTIILATVAMFASRWLFRGYGTSRRMRPVHAAMAGIDSVVLLDEAHLSRPLRKLFYDVPKCDFPSTLKVAPMKAVSLSATAPEDREVFELSADDRKHPLVQERLQAAKRAVLVEEKPGEVGRGKRLAELAIGALEDEAVSSVVVFANSPSVARHVAKGLEKRTKNQKTCPRIEVLTGQFRGCEADIVRKRLASYKFAGGRDNSDVIVVATQTLEVGADYDFDYLVTEIAGVRSLTQRLGRLNRAGKKTLADGATNAAICGDDSQKGLYGVETHDLWQRLEAAVTPASSGLDLSPLAIGETLGEPVEDEAYLPELLPCHLWDWAKTSSELDYEAKPSEFFAPNDDEIASISIAWRSHAVVDLDVDELLDVKEVSVFPPIHNLEICEVPFLQAKKWLEELDESGSSWWEVDAKNHARVVKATGLRPGSTVIVEADSGGYRAQFGFDPECKDVVSDISWAPGQFLSLSSALFTNFEKVHLVEIPRVLSGADDSEIQSQLELVISSLQGVADASKLVETLREFVQTESLIKLFDVGGERFLERRKPGRKWVREDVRSDALDELSFDVGSITLSDHLGSVGELAERVAVALGLSEVNVATLRFAGLWHDAGKADDRFQRWLNSEYNLFEGSRELRAKSGDSRVTRERKRIAAGWPQAGRHELLSARLAEAYFRERTAESTSIDVDLAIHLIASHHGMARPLHGLVDDQGEVSQVSFQFGESRVSCAGRLDQQDWAQPGRYRKLCETYGYWGLALLEWALRSADWAASSKSGKTIDQVVR